MSGFAAIILAGGRGRRLGGTDKPGLPVGGRSMLSRVLAAVADADPRILVGGQLPDRDTAGVRHTSEQPPGGGPVAATAAGLALLDEHCELVALLAGDLPMLTVEAVAVLRSSVVTAAADGAVYVDGSGHRQMLCGVWRTAALRAAVDRLAAERGGPAGAPMRAALAGLTVTEVSWARPGPAPWWDVDTPEDLRAAEDWLRRR